MTEANRSIEPMGAPPDAAMPPGITGAADSSGAGARPRVVNHKGHSRAVLRGIYVGRPTKFGNPFVIGRDGTRAEVVQKYREWIASNPDLYEAAQRELRGQNLICWCAPEPCHADVLLEIANV